MTVEGGTAPGLLLERLGLLEEKVRATLSLLEASRQARAVLEARVAELEELAEDRARQIRAVSEERDRERAEVKRLLEERDEVRGRVEELLGELQRIEAVVKGQDG